MPSANTSPLVSVVVPCRNEASHIEMHLQGILSQQPPEGGFEVVVADGESDDGTREILHRLAAQDSRLRVVDNPGRIASTGLNAAIRIALGRVIIRMDAHTSYAPNYICECVAVQRETGADNVGGPWVAQGRGYIARANAAAFQSAFAVGGARSHRQNYEGPVDSVYLGCWDRTVFDRFGFFDESLVRNQDDEFNLRLTRAGGRVWQSPRIRSWYSPRGSLRLLFRQYLQYGYWKVRVIQKHRLPASPRHLVPGLFVLSLLVLSAAAFFSPAAAMTLLALAGIYGAGLAFASLLTASRAGFELLPVLPLVFLCYHFGYGVGYLWGVCDWLLLRRQPSARFTTLTRTSSG